MNRYAAEAVKETLVDEIVGTESLDVAPPDKGAPPAPTVSPLRPMNAVMPTGNARAVQTAEVTAVEALGERQALSCLRTLQTFSYSVNLLFCRSDVSYYITLSQEGTLWRALHATELDAAESAFRNFEDQAVRLADVELRHQQLEAQNERAEAMIAASEAQAEQLRQDLERHAEQTQLVNSRQQLARKDIQQLEMQRVASQARLNKAMRQLHQLSVTSNERIPHLTCRRSES
ncbi:DUF2968 domain-containing protein [Trinickia dinghuensis]|nr:DUF2968 domain-containing protein [Trinickia dinghuensis]